jgi:hypothetical protein
MAPKWEQVLKNERKTIIKSTLISFTARSCDFAVVETALLHTFMDAEVEIHSDIPSKGVLQQDIDCSRNSWGSNNGN